MLPDGSISICTLAIIISLKLATQTASVGEKSCLLSPISRTHVPREQYQRPVWLYFCPTGSYHENGTCRPNRHTMGKQAVPVWSCCAAEGSPDLLHVGQTLCSVASGGRRRRENRLAGLNVHTHMYLHTHTHRHLHTGLCTHTHMYKGYTHTHTPGAV